MLTHVHINQGFENKGLLAFGNQKLTNKTYTNNNKNKWVCNSVAYNRDFNKVSGVDGFSTEAVGQSVAQKSSLFTKLNTTNVRTNIQADTSVSVKADVAGASGTAASVQAGMAGAGAEVDRQFAAGMEVIEDRQNEILASAQANNVAAGDAFPDTAMAPDSVAGFAVGAFEMKTTAPLIASAMNQGASFLSIANDVAAGMRGRPVDEIKDAIKDTLIASSSPDDGQNSFAGVIVDANETPTGVATPVDWEQVFAEHPDALDQIMYASKDNLQAFPELAALQAAGEQIDDKVAELQIVQDEAEEYGFNADGIEVAGELPPAQIVAADEGMTGSSLMFVATMPADVREAIIRGGMDKSDTADGTFNREPDPEQLLAMNVGAGAMV